MAANARTAAASVAARAQGAAARRLTQVKGVHFIEKYAYIMCTPIQETSHGTYTGYSGNIRGFLRED